MKRTIDDYIGYAIEWMLTLIIAPFFWLYDKIKYYTSERQRLLDKITELERHNVQLRIERNQFREQHRCYEIYQSENERLRRKLSSKGVSAKQLRK